MHSETIFSILDSVDSTNNYAMGKVHAGLAKHGMCWFSRVQSAGKGQRSKAWLTEPGANITMSIVVYPQHFSLADAYVFNMAIAVACRDFLNEVTAEKFKIKWPNDLMWGDRKAGGLLIENIIRGNNWIWSVVGIGININQVIFPDSLKNAVSLKLITNKHYHVTELARKLHQQIILSVEKAGDIITAYNEALYKKGEQVKFKKGDRIINAAISHVDTGGRLHVAGDQLESFSFGEVEWLL